MTHTAGYFSYQTSTEKFQAALKEVGIASKIIKKFGFLVLVSKKDYARAREILKIIKGA